MRACASFPPELESASAARHFAEGAIDDWAAEVPALVNVRDTIRLLVSELVVNVVRHARTDARLTIDFNGHCLRLEVADDNPEVPAAGDGEPGVTTGRGLLILDGLADRWGVDPCSEGKSVWFELVAVVGSESADGVEQPGLAARFF